MAHRPPAEAPALEYAAAIASEIRAEMARQKKTQVQLAEALGITPITASRRLNGTTSFDAVEIFQVAQWLGVQANVFYPHTPVSA